MLGGPSLVHFDPHAFLDGVLRMTRQSVVAQNVLTHTHTPASSGVNPRVCFLSLIFPVSETVTTWGTYNMTSSKLVQVKIAYLKLLKSTRVSKRIQKVPKTLYISSLRP